MHSRLESGATTCHSAHLFRCSCSRSWRLPPPLFCATSAIAVTRPEDTMSTATADAGRALRPAHYGSISRYRKRALRWSYFFLILFVIFFLMPPVYMLITSLKTSAEIGAVTNPWFVYHPTLENYVNLLTQKTFLTFFRNSAIVSVLVVSVTMVISVLAAFSLARMKFWGSATLATGVFLTYLIPDTLLFIPLFKIFAWIHDQ